MKILYASLLAGILVVSVMSSGLSAWAADIQVLYFVDAEIAARLSPLRPVLNVTSAAGKTIEYTETDAIENEKDRLGDFHIVWLGFNAISDNGNNHIAGVEQALLDYTSAGGMVFSESPDNEGFQDNWLPSPISGVEDAEHTNVEATAAAGDLSAQAEGVAVESKHPFHISLGQRLPDGGAAYHLTVYHLGGDYAYAEVHILS